MSNKKQLQANNDYLANILSIAEALPTQESLKHGAYVWKKLTAEGGDFIDYVVSDDPTAYPDGGMQDGYWYSRIYGEVIIDDTKFEGDLNLSSKLCNLKVSTLPYAYPLCAVDFNSEIHIFGCSNSATYSQNGSKHYKWDGFAWTQLPDLPIVFRYGVAIVYNSEIHLLGGNDDYKNRHYKWDGSSWTEVSTLPFDKPTSAAIHENEIHILGGGSSGTSITESNKNRHYKWDGSAWTEVSTLPFYSYNTVDYNLPWKFIEINNNLDIMCSWHSGSGLQAKYHRRLNGTEWDTISSNPSSYWDDGSLLELDGEIHIIGGGYSPKSAGFLYTPYHNKCDSGTGEWVSVGESVMLPYFFYNGCATVHKNEIHILGGDEGDAYHYKIGVKVFSEVAQ